MKSLLVLVFAMFMGLAVNAQSNNEVKSTNTKVTTTTSAKPAQKAKHMTTTTSAQTTAKTTTNTKDHVCTIACKKKGDHVYAHGETGHVCGADCKKAAKAKKGSATMSSSTEMKTMKETK